MYILYVYILINVYIIYIYIYIYICSSFVTVSELFCCDFFEIVVILLPVKSLVAFADFDITLIYYYINLISSITFCLFSGDIYLPLDISWLRSFVTSSGLFCCDVFETPITLLSFLLPIKSSVSSALFFFFFFSELLFLKQL